MDRRVATWADLFADTVSTLTDAPSAQAHAVLENALGRADRLASGPAVVDVACRLVRDLATEQRLDA
jgi:hypothetical protein